MEIQLLTISNCPHRASALDHLHEALDRVGAARVVISERVIDDPAVARAVGMHGSPTVLIDGRDPFASAGSDGSVSCRLYGTPSGLHGAPGVDALVNAIARPTDGPPTDGPR